MDSTAELVVLMEPVALAIWGKPTERSKSELRFGRKGSVSVDLTKGTWFDHEAGEGGGVLDALKLRMSGIHEDQQAFAWLEQQRLWSDGHARPRRASNGAGGEPHEQRQARSRAPRGELVATYDYTDEHGELLFQVQRFIDCETGQRDFRQRHRGERGEWINNIKGVRRVPYRLPELLEAAGQDLTIYIVEGEKDVDNLRRLGVPATCNPMGAGKWPNMAGDLNRYFEGVDVVILVDNDKAGRDHAHEVAESLQPIARSVRVLDLAQVWPACPPKGDISDWLEARADFVADNAVNELYQIIDRLDDWTPAQAELTAEASIERPRHATPYVAPEPTSIPKRAWLFGGHYIRQAATATVAPGGYGKTTLQIFEAVSMVGLGLKVWYLSGEDPKVEIDRRIAAHCQQHNLELKDQPGRLYVDDRNSFPFFIGKSPRAAAVIFDDALLEEFEAAILEAAIDVVMLDPFVSFHSVPENDNGSIDVVVKRLALIGYRTNSCIEISHRGAFAPRQHAATH